LYSKIFFMELREIKPILYLKFCITRISKKALPKTLWRAGYTPADRQTSWGVLHHTAQYLYSACI
jgi:hypothetical protein